MWLQQLSKAKSLTEMCLEAIFAFKSQFHNPDSKEPATYISSKAFGSSFEVRARYFGFQIGVKYGEPFLIKGPLKINNIWNIFA